RHRDRRWPGRRREAALRWLPRRRLARSDHREPPRPRQLLLRGPPRLRSAARRLGPGPARDRLRPPARAHRMSTAHLRVIHGEPEIDLDAAQRAVQDLLVALGQDLDDEHGRDTPRRVAAAYAELLTPSQFNLTTFPNDEQYDELVVARDIPFHSLCQHHLLPFTGVAHVGYLPGDRILGLSKLARGVEKVARGLQVQERLTQQVADWLQEHLDPKGVGVVMEAEHL